MLSKEKDMMLPEDDHDLGFVNDLPRMLGRRGMLTMMGGVGLTAIAADPAAALDCVALPWETAGPYPADGSNTRRGQTVNALTQSGVIRSDLRPSFGGMSVVADGVRLDLELVLQSSEGCTPLVGHAIYIWHCDTTGLYSLYDVPEANWLRGVGLSDAEGKVHFTSIFPGCYDGRWPHIHFEIFESAEAAVSGAASLLTAQIALPEADCAAVYAQDARYSNGTRNLGRITLARDNVFSDNTDAELAQQMLAMSGDPVAGYRGTVTIPVGFTADRNTAGGPPPPGGFLGRWLRGGPRE
ncbi:intradiol ring-cleavage dioxygenase [Sinirhodobacter populi]|uniref:Intradiol ring-cleavage dioxygenase n=2 Tax=Paenirhodobacter populi TaxID=2306993 RepID=A0A443K0T4_9RHOB|nr:intradiol ring-cleavage dioxygenase [Sinirhodobacter populi]